MSGKVLATTLIAAACITMPFAAQANGKCVVLSKVSTAEQKLRLCEMFQGVFKEKGGDAVVKAKHPKSTIVLSLVGPRNTPDGYVATAGHVSIMTMGEPGDPWIFENGLPSLVISHPAPQDGAIKLDPFNGVVIQLAEGLSKVLGASK